MGGFAKNPKMKSRGYWIWMFQRHP